MNRKYILAAAMILTAAFVTSAAAHGRWRGGGHGMKRVPLAEQLGLTAEQQTAWDEVKASSREQAEALREEHRAAFESILTPEQLTALEELRADSHRRHRCRRARLTEELGLTPEQQAAWDAAKTALKEAKAALREERRAAFEAILDAEQLALLEEIRGQRACCRGEDTGDSEEPGDAAASEGDTQTVDAVLQLGLDAEAEAATAVQETSWGTVKDLMSR